MATPSIGDIVSRIRRQVNANASGDPNVGSAQAQANQSNSLSGLLSTLVPVALIALIWLVLFLVLRRKFPRNYSPRTFMGSLKEPERSPTLPNTLLSWLGPFFKTSDTVALNSQSLDGYLLLRLLKISIVICLVGCCITWPVLFPVNITGGGGKQQLDLLTMSNCQNNYYKYFAHVGCAWLFFGFVIFMITRESIFYINLRQAYLMSPLYAQRISSRTVLYTSVPAQYQNEAKLREMLGPQVRRIWIVTDTKKLDDMVEARDKAALKLEAAETKLITMANGARLKAMKKNPQAVEESQAGVVDDGSDSGSVAARWIKPKDRPTHRLKFLIGKKVDTINWCRDELRKLIPKVETEQEKHRHLEAKKFNSVFVEFDTVGAAQSAYQNLTHHQVLHMAPRYTGMTPTEVIWGNLRILWWERVIRVIVVISFVVALVIFWSIPVAVVASISNVNNLIIELPWLGFINSIPKVILGVVTGLLPVVLLAALMSLLPIVLRLAAKFSGDPTLSAVELSVQNFYFAFQLVQVFLVATLGSAASASAAVIAKDPSKVTDLLSQQLPKASNFYISFFILQGLGVVSSMMVGLAGLVIFYVLGKFLDKTPRKLYKRWTNLSGLQMGTVVPIYTNLLVIAICYACIAPLVLGFAAIGLSFFYFAYRYNLLYVYNNSIDTKGVIYPRALQHLFVGLYIAEVCMIGLCAIKSADGALGPLILMIAFLIFTALYNIALNSAVKPLIDYLPKSLEAEEQRLLGGADGYSPVDDARDAEDGKMMSKTEGTATAHSRPATNTTANSLPPAPHKKPSLLAKFFRPHIYQDYAAMRRLVPRTFAPIVYDEQTERDAYYPPSVVAEVPLLWIPRDPVGISRQEIRHSSKVVPITDEGAHLDEKNKIVWDAENSNTAPIAKERIYY